MALGALPIAIYAAIKINPAPEQWEGPPQPQYMRNPERDEAIKREEAEAAKANQERVEQQIASKATLESALKDQDSAKYGDVVSHQLANGTFAFCGMVNARNGFGGYAGYQRFVATPSAAATEEAGGATFRKTWNRVCTKPGDPVEMW